MEFRVKDMDISTGGPLIAILHQEDAEKLDLHSGDRVLLTHNKKKAVCILDISESNKAVSKGKVGLFEEVLDKLCKKKKDCVRHGVKVDLSPTGKPESILHIRKKLHGERLNYKEFLHIAQDITNDRLTDIEKTYFVSAAFTRGLNLREIVDLTKAMVKAGDKLQFAGITLDKHCVGGVPGNRTTMIVIPIIAAAGFTIPKTSSRAITSPSGTADTMECLAKVELPEGRIKHVVKKVGACIIHGGSMNLAPADDKIIDIEHPLSIDAEGQLLASVMAKKYSVSANHVLIDIPMGKSTKARNWKDAKRLKKMFQLVGKKLGMNVKVLVTDGSHPIGNGIGPLLEAEDVMAVLRNDPLAPQDLREKALCMAGILLKMAGVKQGAAKAEELLRSGQALKKMKQIIKEQGRQKKVELGKERYIVKSRKTGKVKAIDNLVIAKLARIAGAPKDKGAGLYLNKRIRQKVVKGEVLYTIYAESRFKLQLAAQLAKKQNGFSIQ